MPEEEERAEDSAGEARFFLEQVDDVAGHHGLVEIPILQGSGMQWVFRRGVEQARCEWGFGNLSERRREYRFQNVLDGADGTSSWATRRSRGRTWKSARGGVGGLTP